MLVKDLLYGIDFLSIVLKNRVVFQHDFILNAFSEKNLLESLKQKQLLRNRLYFAKVVVDEVQERLIELKDFLHQFDVVFFQFDVIELQHVVVLLLELFQYVFKGFANVVDSFEILMVFQNSKLIYYSEKLFHLKESLDEQIHFEENNFVVEIPVSILEQL